MNNETGAQSRSLHSLIPLDDFKALLGLDDREDKISRFCLVTATFTIEQYCKRRLLLSVNREQVTVNSVAGADDSIGFFSSGGLCFYLKEYPVAVNSEQVTVNSGRILGAEFYRVVPECGSDLDVPFYIELSPVLLKWRDLKYVRVVYSAGYSIISEQVTVNSERESFPVVPPDLASACLELAGWNLERYRGKRFSVTSNGRKEGERFEMAMPENVKGLLEPYKRKVI